MSAARPLGATTSTCTSRSSWPPMRPILVANVSGRLSSVDSRVQAAVERVDRRLEPIDAAHDPPRACEHGEDDRQRESRCSDPRSSADRDRLLACPLRRLRHRPVLDCVVAWRIATGRGPGRILRVLGAGQLRVCATGGRPPAGRRIGYGPVIVRCPLSLLWFAILSRAEVCEARRDSSIQVVWCGVVRAGSAARGAARHRLASNSRTDEPEAEYSSP